MTGPNSTGFGPLTVTEKKNQQWVKTAFRPRKFSHLTLKTVSVSLKPGTHWPNRWTSEAFGETLTRSGTNLFGVFSCVGSFQGHMDVDVAPIQHAKSEEVGCRPSEPLDSLISQSAWCVGGAEYCVRFVFRFTLFRHFLFSCCEVLARD